MRSAASSSVSIEPTTSSEPTRAIPARSAVPAVDMALVLLEHLAATATATPTEIARQCNLSRIGVTRVLQALSMRGYVQREESTNRYQLTPKLFSVAVKAPPLNWARAARAHLERLCAATGETAELAIPDSDQLLLVDAVDSPQPIRINIRPGSRESLYRMATGKVILACSSTDFVTRLFRENKLIAKPEYQPRSLPILLRELATIQKQGYATDHKRLANEVERIAVALRTPEGSVVGAIGIAGPINRLKVTPQCVRKVQDSARALATELGFIL